MDKNLCELPPEEHAKIPQMPGSLSDALDYMEKDHAFLLKGDVFTGDFLDMWFADKRKEADAIRLRPHPYEFFLYSTFKNRPGVIGEPNGANKSSRRFHSVWRRQIRVCFVSFFPIAFTYRHENFY